MSALIRSASTLCLALTVTLSLCPALGQEPAANSVALPTQILKSGINLNSTNISPNSAQLAEQTGLMPVLARLNDIRPQMAALKSAEPTLDNLQRRQEYCELEERAQQIVGQTNLEIDYVLAEINAERNLYGEILTAMTSKRDKLVARSNAASFYTNGVLWAVGEAFDIPTYRAPRLSIPSGTVSILAGVVPSFFSLWAMHQYNGQKKESENEPNMLAKLFNYPVNNEVDYPASVITFLNSVPPDGISKKTRKEQLIDRWLTDQNIPSFTDRNNRKVLDCITASVSHEKGLSIETLSARQDMLQQLSSEVMKMKRLLLELSMAGHGDKTI
jgi:hypothetical protein